MLRAENDLDTHPFAQERSKVLHDQGTNPFQSMLINSKITLMLKASKKRDQESSINALERKAVNKNSATTHEKWSPHLEELISTLIGPKTVKLSELIKNKQEEERVFEEKPKPAALTVTGHTSDK